MEHIIGLSDILVVSQSLLYSGVTSASHEYPPSSSVWQAKLPYFTEPNCISLVTFAIVLLQCLKAHFPIARGSSGHRLFISAFMITSKVIHNDTHSNKSWTITQGKFTLCEINQMHRYLDWECLSNTSVSTQVQMFSISRTRTSLIPSGNGLIRIHVSSRGQPLPILWIHYIQTDLTNHSRFKQAQFNNQFPSIIVCCFILFPSRIVYKGMVYSHYVQPVASLLWQTVTWPPGRSCRSLPLHEILKWRFSHRLR